MSEIKAIETHYEGCRFRSRLEARWAVFFNALGLTWSYEPQGFELGAGSYLPDFHIATWSAYIEIKPTLDAAEPDYPKYRELAASQGCAVLLLVGEPGPGVHEVVAFDPLPHHSSSGGEQAGLAFGRCNACESIQLAESASSLGCLGWSVDSRWPEACEAGCDGGSSAPVVLAPGGGDFPRLRAAFDAARGARFEHGECGAPLPHQHALASEVARIVGRGVEMREIDAAYGIVAPLANDHGVDAEEVFAALAIMLTDRPYTPMEAAIAIRELILELYYPGGQVAWVIRHAMREAWKSKERDGICYRLDHLDRLDTYPASEALDSPVAAVAVDTVSARLLTVANRLRRLRYRAVPDWRRSFAQYLAPDAAWRVSRDAEPPEPARSTNREHFGAWRASGESPF